MSRYRNDNIKNLSLIFRAENRVPKNRTVRIQISISGTGIPPLSVRFCFHIHTSILYQLTMALSLFSLGVRRLLLPNTARRTFKSLAARSTFYPVQVPLSKTQVCTAYVMKCAFSVLDLRLPYIHMYYSYVHTCSVPEARRCIFRSCIVRNRFILLYYSACCALNCFECN